MLRYSIEFSSLFILPVRIFRVLDVPKRTPAPDDGNRGKVVFGWRGARGPVECPRIPGIVPGGFAFDQRPQQIEPKHEHSGDLKDHTYSDDQVPDFSSASGFVGINPARHPQDPWDVHEIKSQMEADEKQPEMPFGKSLAVPPAAHFREPVVEGSKERK